MGEIKNYTLPNTKPTCVRYLFKIGYVSSGRILRQKTYAVLPMSGMTDKYLSHKQITFWRHDNASSFKILLSEKKYSFVWRFLIY